MSTEKKVYKILIYYGIVVSIIIALIELILKNYYFNYTISFIIGVLTSALCFLISIRAVDKASINYEKTRSYYISSNFFKLMIYGIVMYLVYFSFLKNGVYTCFFGFLSVKICIYIRYKIIERYQDKRRTIDELSISDNIKNKLKANNIFKTKEICLLTRKELKSILEEKEIIDLLYAMKEHELYLIDELEVIEDDDKFGSDEHK